VLCSRDNSYIHFPARIVNRLDGSFRYNPLSSSPGRGYHPSSHEVPTIPTKLVSIVPPAMSHTAFPKLWHMH
jgi:hypothetical protein